MSIIRWMEDDVVGVEATVPDHVEPLGLATQETIRAVLVAAIERGWIPGVPSDAEIEVRLQFFNKETGGQYE